MKMAVVEALAAHLKACRIHLESFFVLKWRRQDLYGSLSAKYVDMQHGEACLGHHATPGNDISLDFPSLSLLRLDERF